MTVSISAIYSVKVDKNELSIVSGLVDLEGKSPNIVLNKV